MTSARAIARTRSLVLAVVPNWSVEALADLTLLLLGFCVLCGLLALVLQALEGRKITVRVWLALAWIATLVIPLLAEGVVAAVSQLIAHVPIPEVYRLSEEQILWIRIGVPGVAFVVTMAALAWLTGRTVLAPLTAMRKAAREIANGNLDVTLRAPQVREVAEVAEAFNAMGAELQDSIRRQAEVEQDRRFLISAIAHDLRTPLFSLRGYLRGLEEGLADTPEKRARYLRVSIEQAERLEHLVADLFTYTRLEYLNQEPAQEPLDLGEIVSQAAESMRPIAEAKRIQLLVHASCAQCLVEGNRGMLARVVINLLENALRYTLKGGHVRLNWQVCGNEGILTVTDDGPGFTADDLVHLFTPLYRGDVSRSRQTGGVGLGLAIARRIVRAHGGELTATNASGGGALLTGVFPVRRGGARDESGDRL